MAPYLGNKFIPGFVDTRRGSRSRGRGGYRGHSSAHGRKGDRESPTRHSDGERYGPYKRYEHDTHSDSGARSAPSRPLTDGLNFEGLQVNINRSGSGYSESTCEDRPLVQSSIETPSDQKMPMAPSSDASLVSDTLSGLDSLEKLRQFKSRIEASRQTKAAQEVDTSSLAKMAEMFLKQQKGDMVDQQDSAMMDQLQLGSIAQPHLPPAGGVIVTAPGPEPIRSESAPSVLSPHTLGVNVVPSPIEPGELKEETPSGTKDREVILKERLRERQQGKPGAIDSTNDHAVPGVIGSRTERPGQNGRLPGGTSPKSIMPPGVVEAQAPDPRGGSSYERNPKNFITYRSLPHDSIEARAARHGPYEYHRYNSRSRSPEKGSYSNGRNRSPEKMSRSISGYERDAHRESRGDQMLRQMAQSEGSRARQMSPTISHYQPPWQQRKSAPSHPNGFHDPKFDREGDVDMRDERSPWRDSFLQEPFKSSHKGRNGSNRASPAKQLRSGPGQPREHERDPPATSRSLEADQEILATLAGLKAQIAKLEAQLPSAAPATARPITEDPNQGSAYNRSGYQSFKQQRSRSPLKAQSPEVIRSRTFSGSRASHPYQPLSPRRPSNVSIRPRQSYEDVRPPWKGSSASNYSRDDTMKRRDEDRYGGYKVEREGSEYRYDFVPSHRERDGVYEMSQGSRNGSFSRGGRGRGRPNFRGRGGF